MGGRNAGYGIQLGEGATTFLQLTDTPTSFGTAGQMVVVNSGTDGLIFTDASGAMTFLALTDTPASFGTAGQLVAVNMAADGLIFTDDTGATTFLALTDTPASFGTAGQVVAVNMAADGLEFVDAAATGVMSFTALTDTPSSLPTLQYLRSNAAGNALEFDDIGEYRFVGTVQITADLDITSTNVGDYQNRIWIINSSGQIDVTVADGLNLTYFAIYVEGASSRIILQRTSSGSVQFDNQNERRYFTGDGVIFVRVAANDFHALSNDAASINFTDLRDTPSSIVADQYLVANNAGNALTFTALPDDVITVQDSGTEESTTIHTINFNNNLAVSVSSGVATVNGEAGTGSSTFLGLTDTPGSFTADRFIRVNAAGNALEYGDPTVGTASTNWDHVALPSGRIPANNRRWYTYTGTSNVSRQMPLESGISSGWHAFFGNDSTTGNLTLTGDFRGSLTTIVLLPQQGCEVSYNGSIFLEGPARDLITVSSFPDWAGNPLRPSTSYSGFSTNANGLNLNNTATRAALLNRSIRVVPTSGRDFQFDLEPINSSDFNLIPIGSGFGVTHQGVEEVVIRPASNDTLTRGGRTHNFANGVRLSPGASITFVRSGQDTWNTTIQSGTITGGT